MGSNNADDKTNIAVAAFLSNSQYRGYPSNIGIGRDAALTHTHASDLSALYVAT